MGAAVLPAIGGGVAFAAHMERTVVGREGAARQQARSVVVVEDIQPGPMVPVMVIMMAPMMMGSCQRRNREH